MTGNEKFVTFMERANRGEFTATTNQELHEIVDGYVDLWRDDWNNDDIPLYEFLGMSQEEYKVFIERPCLLKQLVSNREQLAK